MNNKVLFIATVDKGHILKFHIPYLKYFKERGFEVHVACAGKEFIPYCDEKHELPFERSPFKISNLKVLKKLNEIIKVNSFSLIHCHTPMGGALGRLASIGTRKKGTKVLYTAHGFHFYKGASILNWLTYFPIEKSLSKLTDCIITINEEDYQNSIKYKFKAKEIKYVPGVGVNLEKFSPTNIQIREKLRDEYKFSSDDFIIINVGDLNKNKNQEFLIDVVDNIKDSIPNLKMLLVGDGEMQEVYKEKVNKLGLNNIIQFLGFRNDVAALLKLSDVVVSASKREGLPVNIIEAMATKIPVVATNCRGNRDLIQDNVNGYIAELGDYDSFCKSLLSLYQSYDIRERFGEKSATLIQNYSIENVEKEMFKIYESFL